VELISSDVFGSFTRGRFMNICVLYLANLFVKISLLSKHCVFFFTYSMTMDKVLLNVSDFSFVKPIVENLTCYKVVSACHKITYSSNTHYKI
jgi:hypothetical protein